VTLTFNPLTLKVRSVSDVMRSNFVLNFSEINNPRLSYSDLTIENLGPYRSTQSWIWLEVDFHNFWASSDPWRTAKFLPNPTFHCWIDDWTNCHARFIAGTFVWASSRELGRPRATI